MLDGLFLEAHCTEASPTDIDLIWADGWRNFGANFFRNQADYVEEKWVGVVPLRINLEKFSLRKHQRKLLRQQAATIVRYHIIEIDAEREAMFQKHILRFKDNRPAALSNFLGESPGIVPTLAFECALYDAQEKLYACSYFGIGANSISCIYATFDTDYADRSPGLHTLLAEIEFAQQHGKQYIYLGYAHDVPSYYDYKKNFNGLESYDWQGNWSDFE
jgi:leucyl-tRNA---protein transferase